MVRDVLPVSSAGHDLIEAVQQRLEGGVGDDVAGGAVAFFGGGAGGLILGVDGPFGVVPGELLPPQLLVIRRCHRLSLAGPQMTREGPCPVRAAAGYGLPSSVRLMSTPVYLRL